METYLTVSRNECYEGGCLHHIDLSIVKENIPRDQTTSLAHTWQKYYDKLIYMCVKMYGCIIFPRCGGGCGMSSYETSKLSLMERLSHNIGLIWRHNYHQQKSMLGEFILPWYLSPRRYQETKQHQRYTPDREKVIEWYISNGCIGIQMFLWWDV